jgi:hypothetical protein
MNIVITTLNYTDFQPDAIPMGLTNENIQSAINNAEKILVSLTGCCVLEV